MIKPTQNYKIDKRGALYLLQDIEDHSIDLIITDLPYGLTRCAWDSQIDIDRLWLQYNRIIKTHGAILLFAKQPFTSVLVMSNPSRFRYEWIWEKPQATGHLNANQMPMQAHENILVFYKHLPKYNPQKTNGHKPMNKYTKTLETQNRSDVYGKCNTVGTGGGNTDRYPRSVQVFSGDKQTRSVHDTQKPISLYEYMIKTYTDEGDLVHDSCMGAGTGLIACRNLNRNFIGFEITDTWEKYYTENVDNADQ